MISSTKSTERDFFLEDEADEENIGGYKDKEFFRDTYVPCQGHAEIYENVPTDFEKEKRKDYPYMMTIEELLKKPIDSYVHFYKRSSDYSSVSEIKTAESLRYQLNKYKNKYNEKGEQTFEFTEKPSHTDFGGGKLGIPFEKEKDFQKVYALAIQSGYTCWFVERPTPIIRMCMDFDFFGLQPFEFHKIHGVAFIVQKELKRCFPYISNEEKSLLDVIVSTASYETKEENGIKGIKTGVHMHWGFFANATRCKQIREIFISALTKELGLRMPTENSWENVVDNSIYPKDGKDGSGLRMMGSDKAKSCACKDENHKQKKKRKREGDNTKYQYKYCEDCKGEGAIGKGRPYFPLFVLDIDGNRNLQKEKNYKLDFVQVVWDTSIRTNFESVPDTPKFLLYEGAPTPEELVPRSKSKKILLGTEKEKHKKFGDEKGLNSELSSSNEEWEIIEEFITKHSLPIYKDVYVSKVKTDMQRKAFLISVKGEFSKYCHNIGREHKSNNIYFLITEDGMEQRCLDNEGETSEMKHGPCHAYKSAKIPLTHTVLHVLFKKNKSVQFQLQGIEASQGQGKEERAQDKKLKTLFILGNELCKNLYKVQWLMEKEGDIIIAKHNITKKPKKGDTLDMEKTLQENYSVHAGAYVKGVGKKFSEILKSLGLCDFNVDEKSEENIECHEMQELKKSKKTITSIAELEHKVFDSLQDIVEIVCMMSKKQLQK